MKMTAPLPDPMPSDDAGVDADDLPLEPPSPSPMARPPVAQTSRVVPSVQTGRGVVRTDTHNAANQLPAHAKHKGRGM